MSANRPGSEFIPGNCFGTFKLPDPVAFVAARGEGATIWSDDGRKLTDFVLGSGPMILGHAHPRVVAAIREQAARGTTFYAMNDIAPRLAARIADFVGCAQAVKFVGDGAEATFYAPAPSPAAIWSSNLREPITATTTTRCTGSSPRAMPTIHWRSRTRLASPPASAALC